MVTVTAGAIVGLQAALLDPVSSDDDQRVEVEGRALLAVDRVGTVGVEGILQTVGMVAVGGERNHVGGDIQHQARRGVEELPAEVENQGRKDEHDSLLQACRAHHVGKPLVEKGSLVDDIGAHHRVIPDHRLKVEGVTDEGDMVSATHVSAPIGKRIGGIVGETAAVKLRTHKKHVPPVRLTIAGQPADSGTLVPCHRGVPPDPGGRLRFPAPHRPDEEHAPARLGEIKVSERVMDFHRGKSETFQEISAVRLRRQHTAP